MTVPTSAGFAEMAKHATGTGSPVAFTKIAVGEGSGQVAADTALDDEVTDSGLARATAGTISTLQTTVANDTGSWVHVFTATGTKAITEAGIFNAASPSASDMLIVGTVSPTASMVSGDTLTLTMKCQFLASS
jgi:hypothetical protein